MHHCHWFCLLYTREQKNSNKVKAPSWESGNEVARVTSWRSWRESVTKDRLSIVLCCLPLLRLIEMAKKNQQYVGPLKWESWAKVKGCCLILFFELDKDLESQIGIAS